MRIQKKLLLVPLVILLISTNKTPLLAQKKEAQKEIVLASEINWGYLNPARGDKSPAAANLWGDRTKDEPSGILVKFNDGFSSPPHIHNITYLGIVIKGLVHNDDPTAENMWLSPGSFWVQPAGESHITAAKGAYNLAYIEINSGPYQVLPVADAFDNGERPINVEKTNLVWLDASHFIWKKQSKFSRDSGVKMAFLWGKPQTSELSGTMIKLAAGFKGEIKTEDTVFRAVVIQGNLQYDNNNPSDYKILEPSSYFGSKGVTTHKIATTEETLIYIRSQGKFEVKATK